MWQVFRARATLLSERYPFASEVLGLYLALLDVWESDAVDLLPGVLKAVETSGPQPLIDATRDAGADVVAKWLAGEELSAAETFVARAVTRPAFARRATDVLSPYPGGGAAAPGAVGSMTAADPAGRVMPPPIIPTPSTLDTDPKRCPACGGLPQVAVRISAGEPLVSGKRQLTCSRCGHSWDYSSTACASCGENGGSKRTFYGESSGEKTFAHLRIDACASCDKYLIEVDLNRDGRAVPEVDELAAIPLDLYATGLGLSKITPNIMGF